MTTLPAGLIPGIGFQSDASDLVRPRHDRGWWRREPLPIHAGTRSAGYGVRLEFVCFRAGRAHDRFEALGIPLHVLGARMPVTIDWYRRARHLRRPRRSLLRRLL